MPNMKLVAGVFVLLLSLTASHTVQAQAEAQELAVAKAAYLQPLIALRGDRDAFVASLVGMGDTEILRSEAVGNQLASGNASPDEAKTLQQARVDAVTKIEWLCEAGLENYGESAAVRNFRGNVFYDILDRPVDGEKEWLTAVSLDSEFAEPYNNLGMHYFHTGSYLLGFQNMDKALELEPKNPDFCFNMAQNYLIFRPQAEKHRNWSAKRVYKEAMALSEQAIKSAPDDYQLLEDYAVNFLAATNFGVKADWKDAARAWQAARKYAPNDIKRFYTWLNEGRMWSKLDKKSEARDCFEEALAIMPDNEIVTRLLKELDEV